MAVAGPRRTGQVELDLDPVDRTASGGSGSASGSSDVTGSKSVISGSITGSIVVGQRDRTVLVVHDRERLTPVALPAEQPVAQLVGDRALARARRAPATR